MAVVSCPRAKDLFDVARPRTDTGPRRFGIIVLGVIAVPGAVDFKAIPCAGPIKSESDPRGFYVIPGGHDRR